MQSARPCDDVNDANANVVLPYLWECQQFSHWCWCAVITSIRNTFGSPDTKITQLQTFTDWAKAAINDTAELGVISSTCPVDTAQCTCNTNLYSPHCNRPNDPVAAATVLGLFKESDYSPESEVAYQLLCNDLRNATESLTCPMVVLNLTASVDYQPIHVAAVTGFAERSNLRYLRIADPIDGISWQRLSDLVPNYNPSYVAANAQDFIPNGFWKQTLIVAGK